MRLLSGTAATSPSSRVSIVRTGEHLGERGTVGSVLLLALLGIAVGATLGYFLGGVLAGLLCRPEPGEMNEGCGIGFFLLTFLGFPVGGIIGGTIGALTGREPKRRAGAGASGPARRREAPAASWLAVLGGIALLWAALDVWVIGFVYWTDRLPGLVAETFTSGSELLGALAGVLFIVSGAQRVVRPGDRIPGVLFSIGIVLVVVALFWGTELMWPLAGVLFALAWLLRVVRPGDRIPSVLLGIGVGLVLVALALQLVELGRVSGMAETSLDPEFWVAVLAGGAGLLALFADRASQRHRQRRSQAVEHESA